MKIPYKLVILFSIIISFSLIITSFFVVQYVEAAVIDSGVLEMKNNVNIKQHDLSADRNIQRGNGFICNDQLWG